ncbi:MULTISPECIES: hypothetical protein [Nocardia]|uniref:hypothetical protein n=1 Tax=Nocardia TaxID=1817 RepID=UPI002E12F707|nr:hypothetical protein OIE68_23610 [Nocardia vinacea]
MRRWSRLYGLAGRDVEQADTTDARPNYLLTVAESQRIMQQHKDCRAVMCPHKATALRCLVQAGKLAPAAMSPRERAAARGLAFPLAEHDLPVRVGPDLRTLLDVLDGLLDPAIDDGGHDGTD